MTSPPPLPATLPEFEAAARAALDAGAFGYISGGATDEWTLAENVAAWRRLALLPRVLTGTGPGVDTSVMVLGAALPHPVIAAPMAYQGIAAADGEVALARAAAATATTLCLSTLSTVSARDLAIAVPDARRWFQVYVFTDRGVTDHLIESAIAFGYEALVITVDFPISGLRERDVRTGFVVSQPVPSLTPAGLDRGFEPHLTERVVDPRLTWDDLAGIVARHRVPVLVKGILRAGDALLAVDHGAAGVVVSNHGGRQLDGTPATATVLGGIVDAVGDRGDVLVDGGIRRGADVVRALALGARAVMVGRPLYWGLAAGGAAGARRVLELLVAETASALTLLGVPSARQLTRDVLHPG